jgi:alpha-L-fucosidase
MFAIDVASSAAVYWQPLNDHRARVEVDLRGPKTIGIAALSEDIRQGQIVARYILEGERDDTWIMLSEGTTIGYRKLDRFDPVVVRRIRLTIADAVETPRPVQIGLFAPA